MKQPKKPKVIVTRKFLLKLADRIYNAKRKRNPYLRLCAGTLVNGADPKQPTRIMHCGLGELYFAMTGKHPRDVRTQEAIDYAIERSSLKASRDAEVDALIKPIRKSKLTAFREDVVEQIRDLLESTEYDGAIGDLEEALWDIAHENDHNRTDDATCTEADYKARAIRVAKCFREAAKLLT